VVWRVAEQRGHERQAAEELGQGKTHGEERRVIEASPAAIKPAARHGEPAQVFPANAAAPDGRPRVVASGSDGGSRTDPVDGDFAPGIGRWRQSAVCAFSVNLTAACHPGR